MPSEDIHCFVLEMVKKASVEILKITFNNAGKILMQVGMVNNDIPLLISKFDMSKKSITIDFSDHQAAINNKRIKLNKNVFSNSIVGRGFLTPPIL